VYAVVVGKSARSSVFSACRDVSYEAELPIGCKVNTITSSPAALRAFPYVLMLLYVVVVDIPVNTSFVPPHKMTTWRIPSAGNLESTFVAALATIVVVVCDGTPILYETSSAVLLNNATVCAGYVCPVVDPVPKVNESPSNTTVSSHCGANDCALPFMAQYTMRG
jgi:hypothetical protein